MIRTVAVLGSGVMGAQIAAHFANAGVPVLLLDVTADAAAKGLQRARALKPDPFFTRDAWRLITTAGFDDGLPRVGDADWILEAVVENLDVKRELLARVDAARRPGTIVSSNTSGIPIAALAEGRSDDFRRHWLGTHFFNPPRYLHLLEIIPTPETSTPTLDMVTSFADLHLGKGVVVARDSPGFIGNHLGLFGICLILDRVAAKEVTIEEVDEITGPAIGRPKSATFRTLDLAGIDIFVHVMRDLRQRIGDRYLPQAFTVPAFVEQMLARGLTGEKAGQGFYKRVKGTGGESEILTIDLDTLEYRPRLRPRLPSIEGMRPSDDLPTRVRTLFGANDKVGRLLRETLAPTLVYAAIASPDIAGSADDVDRVMRWGFGWEAGPFELIDAIGVERVLDATREHLPALLERGVPEMLADAQRTGRDRLRDHPLPPASPAFEILRAARDASRIVKTTPGASLVDLGDGVLCVEFHSKMNVIGGDTIQMLDAGVREASKNFAALVVGNEAANFSAGANIMLVLLEAREENWEDIDAMVRAFQQVTMALKYADVPVVMAPAGLALGGGCEIVLHGDRVQAAAETYMGLVEVGVGLIPAGGGTKEMVARAADEAGSGDLLPPIQKAFEAIGFASVSSSAADARRLGYLREADGITMNRDRLLSAAAAVARQRAREGYQPPVRRNAIRVGGDAVLAPLMLGVHLAWRAGRISDHDRLIGRTLATIMAGGKLPHPTTVSEQHLLDLEREAFLSLVGQPKTQERMQHTLKTGKPLRN